MRESDRRRFAEAAFGLHHAAAKRLAAQKRAGRKHDAAREILRTVRAHDAAHRIAFDDEIFNQPLHDRQVRLRAQHVDRQPRVGGLVHQLAQRAHRRPFAFV